MGEKERTVKQIAKGNNVTQVAGDHIIVVADVQSVFEDAVTLINSGKAEAGQVLLERTWRSQGDTMRTQQQSNCWRLIGCALERQDKYDEAGRAFLKAKELAPEWEKARVSEALGYLCLGNHDKAHSLAECVVQDFAQNTIAWSVWIQTVPDTLRVEDIQVKVPAHLLKDSEIAIALATAAAARGDYERAEELAAPVRERMPENPRVTERLANFLFQRVSANEEAIREGAVSAREREILLRALGLYSSALRKWEEEGSAAGCIRVRLARAWTSAALGEYEKARIDAETAYERASDDPAVSYTYAALIGDKDLDLAIETLKKVVGKDAKPAVEHLLADMLSNRNKGDDRSDALSLLKSRVKDVGRLAETIRFAYLSSLVALETELSGTEPALATLQILSQEIMGARVRGVLECKVLWLAEKKEDALRMAKELYDTLAESATLDEKRRLASLLQLIGLHREALCVWRDIVRLDCLVADTYGMIDCAKRCGADDELLRLASGLRQNGIWDKSIFEYEIYLREKYNDWKECRNILQEFIKAAFDQEYLPYARAHLSHVGAVLREFDLVERDVSRLPLPTAVHPAMGRLIVQALRMAGERSKAVEYAYEVVRSHFESLEAHTTMASFMIPLGLEKPELKIPAVVVPGVAVEYREQRTGTLHWHVIEDSTAAPPDTSRNEYPSDHPYSEKMLGLRTGDTFLLRGGEIQERRAAISRIISKYDYRIGDCTDRLEDRFPGCNVVVKINAYKEDGQIDLDPIKRLADMGEKKDRELLDLYRNRNLPIYSFAMLRGTDVLDTLSYLAARRDVAISCRTGHPSEVERAIRALSDATEIVLDEMALATLLLCKASGHLARLPQKLVVSEGTLVNLENWRVLRMDASKRAASTGNIDGKLVFMETSQAEVEEIQGRILSLASFIRKDCVIESGMALSFFKNSQRDSLSEALGGVCAETLAVSRSGQRVLWTDDLTCAYIHTHMLGGTRVWTQFIFEYLAGSNLLERAVVNELILTLISLQYWFTSLNTDIAIAAAERTDWDPDRPPLRGVLSHFGDARVMLDANLMLMMARLLKHCWDEDALGFKASAMTWRVLNELAKRPEAPVPTLVTALWIWMKRLFGIDAMTLHRVESIVEDWLDSRGGGIVLP